MPEKPLAQVWDKEVGNRANPTLVRELTAEISSSWQFRTTPPKKPVLLYLGGFQGSGKTTALEIVRRTYDLAIISPDEIRDKLTEEKGFKTNGEIFTETVNATRNNLLRVALRLGHHIAIDQLTTSTRVKLIKKIMDENASRYSFRAVFISAKADTLEKRVLKREGFEGRYKGTVNELMASLRQHSRQGLGLYDMILNGDEMDPQQIADILITLLCGDTARKS